MKKDGLTTVQAENLLKQYGLNQLPSKSGVSAFTIFLRQFNNILAYLLIGAATLSFLVSDAVDGSLILFILFINAALGFSQEYKASKELEALKKLEVDMCRGGR